MKKNKKLLEMSVLLVFFICVFPLTNLWSENLLISTEVEGKVREIVEESNIPGLCLVMIKDGRELIKCLGYSDLRSKTLVTPETRFELASCSKAFTALAVIQLDKEGLLYLDTSVSGYFPWFSVYYGGKPCKITIRQLLHHTSGIPWEAFSKIPEGEAPDSLVKTLRLVNGMELKHLPGDRFGYNSLNYAILGAVIEKVTGKTYENYMSQYIFKPLGLSYTTVGVNSESPSMATGYKRGFFIPRKYNPPIYRGNNPAAYVISNALDISRWMKLNLYASEGELSPMIKELHQPDLSVKPGSNYSSYSKGWFVNQYSGTEVFHSGLNPNFSAYIGFRPGDKIAVAVMANCNSSMTSAIGKYLMKSLAGEKNIKIQKEESKLDVICSVLSLVSALFVLTLFLVIFLKVIGIFKGKYDFEGFTFKKFRNLVGVILSSLPFFAGLYLIPQAVANVSWEKAFVWAPKSFQVVIVSILACFGMSFINYLFNLFYPYKNKYRSQLSFIAVLSIFSGMGNTVMLFIITTSFFSKVPLVYLAFYFLLAYFIHIFGRKIVQTKLINITNNITLDIRIGLLKQILSSRYQQFEKIQDGRIFTTLNGDTARLANSGGLIVTFFTSSVTALTAFVYLATISLNFTVVVLISVCIIGIYNYIISKKSRVFLEEARTTENVYLGLLNGMVRGFKDLSLHRKTKYEYNKDLVSSCRNFAQAGIKAATKFLNAFLIEDSIIFIPLGILSIFISRLIYGRSLLTLMSFIMVLLYLMGPLRHVINSIPQLTRLQVSWGRIQQFIKDLNVSGTHSVREFIREIDTRNRPELVAPGTGKEIEKDIQSFEAKNILFKYEEQEEGQEGFQVGPISFKVKKGEILFITGGNGSGKSTLASLMTGLYGVEEGAILINDKPVSMEDVGEYFSTVFSDYHLFRKLYNVDLEGKSGEVEKYIDLLKLRNKVQIRGNEFSTINLSGGQRKRLALFRCYLEDSPIYLFDEVAADQDPQFRKFYYRELLPELCAKGRIVIAITHDDHYFDVADKVLKLDMGKVDSFEGRERLKTLPGKDNDLIEPGTATDVKGVS
jgi:putative ATP-binding cassette transporter